MRKLERLKKSLRSVCEKESVCLWLSGGSDSRLLLETMLIEKLNFSILSFSDGWTRQQQRVVDDLIKQKNLLVYSYLPSNSMMFGNGEELTLAAQYAIGVRGETMSILRDVVESENLRCAFDVNIEHSGKIYAPVIFDNHIVGSRRDDRHYAFDGAILSADTWKVGNAQFFAPLFDWTRKEVLKALKIFGINYVPPPEYLDTGNVPLCSKCLKGTEKVMCPKIQSEIDSVVWNPSENLAVWRMNNARSFEV